MAGSPSSSSTSCPACPLARAQASRRGFVRTALAGLAALTGGMGLGLVRFLFPRVLYEPGRVFKAGRLEDYPIGEVSTKWKKDFKTFLVRTEQGLYALSATCTHLGCVINWFGDEKLFKCPCHGSNFTLGGDVVAGPAPQPLHRLAVERDADGTLLVDLARKENRPGTREQGNWFVPA